MPNNTYNLFDLGFDSWLYKPGLQSLETISSLGSAELAGIGTGVSVGATTIGAIAGSTTLLSNPVDSPITPIQILSGELGQIFGHGKKTFSDTIAGFLMGLDTDGTYKWYIGDSTSSADWNVTTANTFTVTGTIVASSGTIGGWTINANSIADNATEASANVLIDSANTLIRLGPTSGDSITLDGANQRVRSSNYTAGINGSGFTLEPDLLEVGNIKARGLLRSAVFQKDVVSVVGGNVAITPNSDVLDVDMTALDASTMTIAGTATFAVGDLLRIKDGTDDEWLEVTVDNGGGNYSLNRDKAGAYGADSNPAWTKGASITNYGQSGDGLLFLTASDSNSPRMSIYTHAGAPWTTLTEHVRIGNLNGIGGKSSDTFGWFVGDFANNKYGMYDSVSGNLIINGSPITNNQIFGDGSDGDVTISGNTSLSRDMYYNNLTISSSSILNPAGYRIFVKGTLTIDSGSSISTDGNDGQDGVTGGAGDAAGGAALAAAYLGASGGGGTGGGVSGQPGGVGDSVTSSIGEGGGAGGAGGAGGGGGGGTATAPPATSGSFNVLPMSAILYDFIVGARLTGGAGGGGGGRQAGSDGGGGGGGGALPIFISTRFLVNNGTISANGGDGGDGQSTGVDPAGGGGGGGGADVTLIYTEKTGTGTETANGGAGGAAANAGVAGTAGTDASVIELQV